ncbi:MAG: hypothetical protein KDE28_30880 [Anaerolineales bacterium]|nr:hypothetical protein [Anaerolineales bacterium]
MKRHSPVHNTAAILLSLREAESTARPAQRRPLSLHQLAPQGHVDGVSPDLMPRSPFDVYAAASLSRRNIVSGNRPVGCVTDETDVYDNDEGYALYGVIPATLGLTLKLREMLNALTNAWLDDVAMDDVLAEEMMDSIVQAQNLIADANKTATELTLHRIHEKPVEHAEEMEEENLEGDLDELARAVPPSH